ncbi:MAG: nickel insertion protein, partial [Vicinamibacterales bacterium]
MDVRTIQTMKVLYFDCFAGAAGDMILGALLDAGLPLDALRAALGSLAVDGYEIALDRVVKTGITSAKFRVRELVPA